jgi:hypothetical protein
MQTVKWLLHRRSCELAVTGLERILYRERNIEKMRNMRRFPDVRFLCNHITEMLISYIYVSARRKQLSSVELARTWHEKFIVKRKRKYHFQTSFTLLLVSYISTM